MKHFTRSTSAALIVGLSLAVTGCSGTRYGDPQETETINADYGSTDLQTFAKKMVESLYSAPGLAFIDKSGPDQRIVLYFDNIYNETTEHINMGLLRDKMIATLAQAPYAQRFRIVAGSLGQNEIGDQVRFQQGSGRVDPEQAKAFGRQVGADVVLYGALRDITKKTGRSIETGGSKSKDVYYNFFLRMDDIETAELMWADDVELRKTQVTGLFGG